MIYLILFQLIMMLGVWLFESFIGLDEEALSHVDIAFYAIFWFISIPYCIFCKLARTLDKVKEQRLVKEQIQEVLRIKLEAEVQQAELDLEKELNPHETENKVSSQSG